MLKDHSDSVRHNWIMLCHCRGSISDHTRNIMVLTALGYVVSLSGIDLRPHAQHHGAHSTVLCCVTVGDRSQTIRATSWCSQHWAMLCHCWGSISYHTRNIMVLTALGYVVLLSGIDLRPYAQHHGAHSTGLCCVTVGGRSQTTRATSWCSQHWAMMCPLPY